MGKKATNREEFCGNCTSHNAYNYPDEVFCTRRFLKNENPIVQTLWHCEDYYPNAQECNCIHDAKEKRNNNSASIKTGR
jgi:hypothetical protein